MAVLSFPDLRRSRVRKGSDPMKLNVLDQIHVSSVQADSLKRGDQIDVSEALGAELLRAHPQSFAKEGGAKPTAKPRAKAKPVAKNKAAPAHAGKAATGA